MGIKMNGLPVPVVEFGQYMFVIKGRSPRTVEQYGIDLMLFFKYIIGSREGIKLDGDDFDKINISGLDIDYISSITKPEIMEFFSFLAEKRGCGAKARARKLSTLKSFYKYHCDVMQRFENNPTKNIDTPKIRKSLPKHLNIEECVDLLDAVSSDEESKTRERDFAIITLFLNCGMRLGELTGINVSDIERDFRSLRVLGKGAKERIIYLNDACRDALKAYLKVRNETEIRDDQKNALFISSRHQRISRKTVQWIVYKYLREAGLEYRHLSTHKLRHTAATLMYQTGKVDVRVLKDILGHEQLNTTQIYTHVSDDDMEKAMKQNPLSEMSIKKIKSKKTGEDN